MLTVVPLDLLSDLFGNVGNITQIAFTLLVILLFFGFGQKLQMRQYMWDIDRGL